MTRNLIILIAGIVFAVSTAYAAPFKEGEQYVPIMPQPAVGSGDEVEVVEFFWYGCVHCNDFEPTVTKWAAGLPDNIRFSQVPVMFGGPADLHAQLYYALEGLGELERMHAKLFHVMHVDKRKLRTRDEVDEFLAANGVEPGSLGTAGALAAEDLGRRATGMATRVACWN